MTRFIVESGLEIVLRNIRQRVELVDSAGQSLGCFIPATEALLLEPQIDENEIRRREHEGGGRSLEAILQELEGQP